MKVEMAALSGFDDWLCKKLTSLDIDNNVYGAYIVGILEENEEEPMKKEALTEILESVVVSIQDWSFLFGVLSQMLCENPSLRISDPGNHGIAS